MHITKLTENRGEFGGFVGSVEEKLAIGGKVYILEKREGGRGIQEWINCLKGEKGG